MLTRVDTPPEADAPHELKEYWLGRALASAGIDRGRWHPSVGVEENRRTIEAVYAYYGRLFLDHPHFEWAGMACMIGPAFYAGFLDLGFLPDAARRALAVVFGRAVPRLAGWAAGDLGFYETTFLTMQKKIFEDQAPMHEAYVGGGLPEVEKLCRAYRTAADMAAALSSVVGGEPDRLTVELPAADLGATERCLLGYAAEWGFPAEAIAGWRAGAERRASGDRAYSTHVFTPAALGGVHLEFQVAHDVGAGEFVTSALFSW